MLLFERHFTIPLHWAILFLMGLLTITCVVMFNWFAPPEKGWLSADGRLYVLTSGLVSGMLVAIIQFALSWFEYREISRLRSLKIKAILPTRDDESYYHALIVEAQKEIYVQGVTAVRFLSDFASEDSPRPEKRSLIDALHRNVKVRFLLADVNHLTTIDHQENFRPTEQRLQSLHQQFPDLLEYRYYLHAPAHIIVIIDEDCLFGPKFPGVPSRNTPTIHTSIASPFAESYVKYFKDEWDNAKAPS